MSNNQDTKGSALFLMRNRFVIFGMFLIVIAAIQYYFFGGFLPSTETKDLWFYSGIFMVIFSMLFIEPYFTSPKNVITNAIPLLLVFFAIRTDFENQVYWWAAVIALLILISASIIAVTIEDKDNSLDYWKNRLSESLKKFVVLFGQGKILYSSVFVYFLLTYYSIQNLYTLVLFVLWVVILSINPKRIHSVFSIQSRKVHSDQIGEIFGVQSKKIFLVKLFEDRRSIQKFDIVKFRYSMQDIDGFDIFGIVFDTYLLNQEKWAKVLQLAEPKKSDLKLEKNIVYKISDEEESVRMKEELRVNDLAGVVIEGSTIGKIKFEYSKKSDDLQEGDLLELKVGAKRLFYQVIAGVTEKERLEARNETGFIEGEAVQLGEWLDDKFSFRKFGWVPPINTPMFTAEASDVAAPAFSYPDYKVGVIPSTSLPSVLNLDLATSHHLALLGVTGSGKSHLATRLVNELLQKQKVICIDFTGEWKKNFDAGKLDLLKKENIGPHLMSKAQKLGIFELPELSNTADVLKETEDAINDIFLYAKRKYVEGNPVRISLILEEAHTITPESSFLGVGGDFGATKALVNKMTQVALQGRKYGVGLIVIAQRTANVSKTVLTQCNTVISFQAFDETSFTFLGNYIGKDMVKALPNLKQYHAVVVGKAARANLPMIVDLTEEEESKEDLSHED